MHEEPNSVRVQASWNPLESQTAVGSYPACIKSNCCPEMHSWWCTVDQINLIDKCCVKKPLRWVLWWSCSLFVLGFQVLLLTNFRCREPKYRTCLQTNWSGIWESICCSCKQQWKLVFCELWRARFCQRDGTNGPQRKIVASIQELSLLHHILLCWRFMRFRCLSIGFLYARRSGFSSPILHGPHLIRQWWFYH